MRSQREQYVEVINELDRVGQAPTAAELEPLCERTARLDDELTAVTDRGERHELDKLSREANTLLRNAYARGRIALDVADAARAREIHDALYPNHLSPHRLPTNNHPERGGPINAFALAARREREELERPGPWDGFDR
ncbi:hypothetical protein B7C42_07697 [Nocardia cerradoensis]|uniref:Uncharacterized protein n=1 Tax=Nocardia cerradoensis TaxID=85688 RepID=A0A231GUL0_9NOCA|nr:hypothetical protein [Nocardia cerradoensis]OXR40272.1 hypothetical protein B7C42_07697 [Nocardia cerradoensis]